MYDFSLLPVRCSCIRTGRAPSPCVICSAFSKIGRSVLKNKNNQTRKLFINNFNSHCKKQKQLQKNLYYVKCTVYGRKIDPKWKRMKRCYSGEQMLLLSRDIHVDNMCLNPKLQCSNHLSVKRYVLNHKTIPIKCLLSFL